MSGRGRERLLSLRSHSLGLAQQYVKVVLDGIRDCGHILIAI